MIRTRFAPSPTGYLHVGGLRTALYSYLIAKQNKGTFLLRIEDTDRERFVADGTLNIVKSLDWAGLSADEGVMFNKGEIAQEGKLGPYIQSERLEIYKKYTSELFKANKVYCCFCTPERLQQLRELQEKNKQPTGYDGLCAMIDQEESFKRAKAGEKCAVRLRMPKTGTTEFTDLIRGKVSFKNELQEDFVALKSDGFPTYHLASVIDDHEMQITHVIRGEEWLSSVPKHLQLYQAFGWEAPQFAHLSLLLNPDKSKLSKRQGDVAVEDYKNKGYLPEALLNFVAFLGWNPGTDKEIYSLDELVKDFSLEKVSKAGAVFNLEKLDWYNKEYIKKLSLADLVERAWPWLEAAGLSKMNKKQLEGAAGLERERVTTLAELPEAIKFIFQLPDYEAKLLVWRKGTPAEVQQVLPALAAFLKAQAEWSKAKLEVKIGEWIKEKGYAVGSVLWPFRVALSGQQNSPGPYEIAEVLGKEETLVRLAKALAKL